MNLTCSHNKKPPETSCLRLTYSGSSTPETQLHFEVGYPIAIRISSFFNLIMSRSVSSYFTTGISLTKSQVLSPFDSMNETKEIKLWLYHLGRLRVHSPVLAQREGARYGYWAPAVVIRYLPGDQSAKASGVPRDLAMLGRTRQRHSELMSGGGLKIFDYVSQNLSMDLIKQVKREAESLHYNTL